MANALYECYKQEALGDTAGPGHGFIDWETPGGNGIKASLMDTGDYAVNLVTDQDQVDLTDTGIVATSASFTVDVSVSAGVATIDVPANWTWSSVSGAESETIVVYHDSATDSTSLLAIYYDAFDSGMPVTPNGGDINVTVHANGLWTW